jgi:SPP1 gp7 family putative phage head morphogenesis protein
VDRPLQSVVLDAREPARVRRRVKARRGGAQAKLQAIAARERFRRVHASEKKLARQLRQVAKQVGAIVRGFAPSGVVGEMMPQINRSLERYAELLLPWAAEVARETVAETFRRDLSAWQDLGREIGRNLKAEVERAPTGEVMREKVMKRVSLITSLPREAAQRVQRLNIEALSGGPRAAEKAKMIMETGRVTESRAMLIARTETTATATALVEARAKHIGSPGYIWRTVGDADVRERHRKLEGDFIEWDSPPVAGENGERAHAGAIYNCRCWPEPVLPDVIE